MAETQVQRDSGLPTDVETRSRRQDFQRVFFSNRLAVFGTAVLSVFILMAVFAPLIAPYDPLAQDLVNKFAGPSREHLMGQDELGRDILSRVIYGARISLTAGLAAVAIATTLGTLVGLVASVGVHWWVTEKAIRGAGRDVDPLAGLIYAYPILIGVFGLVALAIGTCVGWTQRRRSTR